MLNEHRVPIEEIKVGLEGSGAHSTENVVSAAELYNLKQFQG